MTQEENELLIWAKELVKSLSESDVEKLTLKTKPGHTITDLRLFVDSGVNRMETSQNNPWLFAIYRDRLKDVRERLENIPAEVVN